MKNADDMDDSALDPYEVWIAPEILECGHDRVYEVPLAKSRLLLDLGIRIPEWFRSLIKDPMLAWSERIEYQNTAGEAAKLIADQLTAFAPVAIVLCGSELYCRCAPMSAPSAASFFIQEMVDPIEIEKSLPENERDCFREVCQVSALLHGFRESYPPQGGHWSDFRSETVVMTDESVDGFFGAFQLTDRWSPALLAFTASNSDALMVNRQNEWGWWLSGSEDPIVLAGESWLSFALAFNEYLAGLIDRTSVESTPFDSCFLNKRF